MLNKHISVFRIRLENDAPSVITPMNVRLDPKWKPVQVKVRRYPTDQRKFMDNYFQKLVDYDLIEHNARTSWQSAPRLVPKEKSKFGSTIDSRPANAATISEARPMPNLEGELADFGGKRCFAKMDLCIAYWQILLNFDSRDASGIIALQGVFKPKRVLHSSKNAAAHFQAHVVQCFISMQNAFKSGLDDFII